MLSVFHLLLHNLSFSSSFLHLVKERHLLREGQKKKGTIHLLKKDSTRLGNLWIMGNNKQQGVGISIGKETEKTEQRNCIEERKKKKWGKGKK
jgi:hypothetical protein